MTRNIQLILAAGAIAAGLTTTVFADTKAKAKPAAEKSAAVTITTAEVNGAQQAWCDALVAIGKVHAEGGDAKALATRVLSEAYAYDTGKVFFKPTLTHGEKTFRPTKQGALAYFVGGDPAFPDDKGFALKPWVKARYDNLGDGDEGIQIHGDIAITMGNVWVTDKDGNEVKVDKTFVFQKGADGKLRLILHKSALPYTPRLMRQMTSDAGLVPARYLELCMPPLMSVSVTLSTASIPWTWRLWGHSPLSMGAGALPNVFQGLVGFPRWE